MFDIVKRTAAGALLLLAMPLLAAVSGWRWQPGGPEWLLHGLYWLTQTVSFPWGTITSGVLFVWLLWHLRLRGRATLMLLLAIVAVIILGQELESAIKDRVREPRPYAVWLEPRHQSDAQAFYALPHKARGELLKTQLQDEALPGWLRRHWRHETGFAFPSGHSVFAATWALLAVGLLWARRRYVTVGLVMAWAIGVMASRLAMGMHWPRDVMASIAIGWLMAVMAIWLARRGLAVAPVNP